MAIDNFERRRIRANRRLYVKARILLRDSPQLFEGFQKFMPANGKGELFRTLPGNFDGGTIMPSTALLKNSGAA